MNKKQFLNFGCLIMLDESGRSRKTDAFLEWESRISVPGGFRDQLVQLDWKGCFNDVSASSIVFFWILLSTSTVNSKALEKQKCCWKLHSTTLEEYGMYLFGT